MASDDSTKVPEPGVVLQQQQQQKHPGCRSGAVWALVLSLVLAPAAWEVKASRESLEYRPVPELQRTIQVLNFEEADYLTQFYFARREDFPHTYFNLLLHRWRSDDKMLGRIFAKIVEAANHIEGGGHDYVIATDFFSYRSASVVQFAPYGQFHHDCDFWKVDGGEGLNLWILLDHHSLNKTFEVLERAHNEAAYNHRRMAGNKQALLMMPLSELGLEDSYRFVAKSGRVPFVSGHSSMLDARAVAYMLLEKVLRSARTLLGKARLSWYGTPEAAGYNLRRFAVTQPNTSRFALDRGEALVLREYELHRTDLNELGPEDFRLAVSFKLFRRNAKVARFLANCPAEKERVAYPALWEETGKHVKDFYGARSVPSRQLEMINFQERLMLVLSSNLQIVLLLAGSGLLLSPAGFGEASFRTSLLGVVLAVGSLLVLVVVAEYDWILMVNEENPQMGGRRTSALKVAWR